MTLKEKITDQVQGIPLESIPTQRDIDKYILSVNNLEKIADEFTLGFLHWYNTSQECETYLRRNYPKNITMNGEHYKKVLELNKELLEIYKKEKGL